MLMKTILIFSIIGSYFLSKEKAKKASWAFLLANLLSIVYFLSVGLDSLVLQQGIFLYFSVRGVKR